MAYASMIRNFLVWQRYSTNAEIGVICVGRGGLRPLMLRDNRCCDFISLLITKSASSQPLCSYTH